jgi:hypothetical protein
MQYKITLIDHAEDENHNAYVAKIRAAIKKVNAF